MKTFRNVSFLLALAAVAAFAQTPVVSTTVSGAITAASLTGQMCVASATSIVNPALTSGTTGSIFIVDNEAMQNQGQGSSTTCFKVKRGVLGTRAAAHANGVKVWVMGSTVSSGDPSRPFSSTDFLATYKYSPFSQFFTPMSPITPTAVSHVSGTVYQVQLNVPYATILTGACARNGATVGTDKYIFALYDNTGALLANTAVAGTTTAGASIYQCLAFTSPIAVVGPATYFLGLQANGANDNFGAYAAGALPTGYGATSTTGTFGTLPAITPPVTFTADKGPYMYVY